MQSPRTLVESVERNPALPSGPEERFAGYGVMGVPFSSGYILALRHFPASSVGPGYTSVWIREPAGVWTMHSTTGPGPPVPATSATPSDQCRRAESPSGGVTTTRSAWTSETGWT